MDNVPANPLARFERRKTHYPLLIATVLLTLVLVIGLAVSVSAGAMTTAAIFMAALGLLGIVLLLDTAMKRRLAGMDDRKFIYWDAAIPELQRQNINIEVRQIARQLGVGDDQLSDLLTAYIVAEDLSLRQIQQEENRPLMRHVSIGGTPFDAILTDQDLIVCIEVAFVVVPDIRQDRIEAMLKRIAQARTNLAKKKSRLRLRLMLVIVTQLTPDEVEELEENLRQRSFKNMQFDAVDIRILDFEMLQKLYLTE